MIKVKRIF